MILTYFPLIHICYPYHFVDILIIEILKVVEKCKIYQNKASQESLGWAFDKKICTGGQDLPNFENIPQGCQGGGMVINAWN